jgi:hypothetical protein
LLSLVCLERGLRDDVLDDTTAPSGKGLRLSGEFGGDVSDVAEEVVARDVREALADVEDPGPGVPAGIATEDEASLPAAELFLAFAASG